MAQEKGFVTGSVVCLHRRADAASEVVTQAKMGDGFRILEEAAPEWWRVALDYDGYEGYLPAREAQVGGFAAGLAIVRNLFANVYAGPKVQHQLLVTLPMGVRLGVGRAVDETVGDSMPEQWAAVKLADGRDGFVHQADLSIDGGEWSWNTLPELWASLVRTARRFLGIPYRWGGTSSFGLDCSGLVQLVYRLHGLFLPRDADQQAQYEGTRPVAREELLPGDLIFFAKYGHVGMAISHHEFIHATTHLDPVVQISAVDDPHWSGLRDEIRRYVPGDARRP